MKKEDPIWYPFTNIKLAEEPIHIVSGEGQYLIDKNGDKYLDMVSSWWTNIYGHNHPSVVKAIKSQLDKLDHIMFAGFTHEPAEDLAKAILEKLGHPFAKVFFSDNGSTSTEVALKMALQYHFNKGETKTKMITFSGSYHGDTFGAMSTGERGIFNKPFEKLLFEVLQVPFPATWYQDENVQTKENDSIESLKSLIQIHKNDIACLIIEPLVQGASGMRMCRVEFLEKLNQLAKDNNIIIIYDEVMTGFGRTGEDFAFKHLSSRPDIICLSKGLTAGALPLALTVTTSAIFEPFYSSNSSHSFYHGHSYTANPISCSAAIQSLKMMDDFIDEKNLIKSFFIDKTKTLSSINKIKQVRSMGCIFAFEFSNSSSDNYLNPIGNMVKNQLLSKRVIIRPLGNTVYLIPPYVTPIRELEKVIEDIIVLS